MDFFTPSCGEKLKQVDWEHWLHAPGLPKFNPNDVVDRALVKGCEQLANNWLKNEGKNTSNKDLDSFSSKQTMFFLDSIITSDHVISQEVFDRLHKTYDLSSTKNVEIAFRYLMLGLKLKWNDILPHVATFLSKHGRGLYVRPLYRSLAAVNLDFAKKTYKQNKPFYHSVIRSYCSRMGLEK